MKASLVSFTTFAGLVLLAAHTATSKGAKVKCHRGFGDDPGNWKEVSGCVACGKSVVETGSVYLERRECIPEAVTTGCSIPFEGGSLCYCDDKNFCNSAHHSTKPGASFMTLTIVFTALVKNFFTKFDN